MGAAHWKAGAGARARQLAPLLALGLILWFVCFNGLSRVALIDLVDEGIYATIARQMVDSGDWVTPRLGQEIFFYKPPLTYWCQAVLIRTLGPTTLAARLPSAIAAFLTSLSLFLWARRRGFMRVGWLAAVMYALCPLLAVGLARVAMMDSLLTLCFTLSVIGWIEGYGGNGKGYLLMAAGMGLATMTKGLIGFLLPSAAFAAWLFVRRDGAALRRVPWVAGLSIFLALVLPWHLAAWWTHGNWFWQEYIVRQHVQRFMGQAFGHNAPFWYYLPVLLAATFPWCAFFVVGWWRGWRRARRCEKESLDCAMAIWALWATVVFAFFSLSRNKLPQYVLPALPAFVLLAAWRLEMAWGAKRGLTAVEAFVFGVPCVLLGVLFMVVGLAGWQWRSQAAAPSRLAKTLGRLLNWEEQSQGFDMLWRKLGVITGLAPYWLLLGALLLLGSIVVIACWRHTARAAGATMLMSFGLVVLALQLAMPAWDNHHAAALGELAQRISPAMQTGEPLVIYDLLRKRASLRYMVGHSGQITETSSPDVLRGVLTDAGRGLVLTETNKTPPPLALAHLRQESSAGEWTLWRYDADDK